jgi:hypothetical protein
MTRAEALSLGYCPHCASYAGPVGDADGRQWCRLSNPAGEDCPLYPQYAEWLRVTFGLSGPRQAEDMGKFEGLKPRGSK